MAHRKSPARRAKDQRIAHLHALSAANTEVGFPWDAIIQLERALVGHIVLPLSPSYNDARQESNHAFQAYPALIAYCECENDVLVCLQFAQTYEAWVAVRCGGHSTAGYSVNNRGMVVDLKGLSGVTLDTQAQRVHVLPGTDFDHFNGAMGATGWHVPTGACGNVCVGGFVQGGGYGYTSRQFGIQSDMVESMRVALADGKTIVTASATENPLLYWALRGGTGGNFGVLLQVTYRMVQLPQVWAWSISWDAANAADVLVMLQKDFMRTGAPDALGYMMNLGYQNGEPVFMIQGMYCGTRDQGMAAVKSLLEVPSAQLLVDCSGTYPEMNAWLEDHPYDLPQNLTANVCETKSSGYINQTLTKAQWQAVIDYFATSPNTWSLAYLEPYGGAIQRYPVEDSAFIHRNADADLVVDVFWTTAEERRQTETWLAGFMDLMRPFLSGEVYQNYPDGSLADFAQAYWGPAYPKLQQAKLQYDPGNFFHFAQSVALPG
ncbi:FAD-binding oxidoreductase [Acidovorax sp. GBBC 3334]|uniref:FAD-binding oxidoreductase n=1 Tax=Acidovorax sp. GBBC 3334 TaxID=2940496 RepID=UPI002302A6E6|nr:FAD-binding oxidoreductase [Acidovorax sp. GBBC 3334]MDA8457227.1 FAD-binding oxidoreductase [Acidovorax sp. GBBC 3334]